jgi:propionyl-CoA carboxylase alpha chain/3-methylcrotonyl-CoA carboxylase alpha subunit/acetyl-CoA/propionyl-CoA carboxylase biotin carboxyl carrier protein
MFRKVLVANRGEIACRVLRTLRAQKIPSVAIHHFVDRAAPHVAMADEAVEVKGKIPSSAYLDAEQILEIARAHGVDAIHPGYGFLSENAGFAELVEKAGITFIGPSASVMRLMGDKIRSREFAARVGVPTSKSIVFAENEDASRASELGFPLLIKASAGGGGKGMKIVRNAGELEANVALARSEAARYFGDGRVYAERLLERPRHIEVQLLGDGKGNVVHLGERECSIQRRYQKIVEESPAPNLDPKLRQAILDAALLLGRESKYENAGTVEFIVGDDGSFFFLEMNTRLQVEHPVTELVTGIDLVLEQLKIAREKKLSLSQRDVEFRGHAIEVRICAEEPERDFRPATGKIGLFRVSESGSVRIDNGVLEGQSVTSAFDSMLMKMSTHGATRAEAVEHMVAALRDLVLLGVPSNIDFLARVVGSEAFRKGELHTGFIEANAKALAVAPLDANDADALAAAFALADDSFRRSAFDIPEPWASMGAFRN